jgi:hypothetical protein
MTCSVERGAQSGRPGNKVNVYGVAPCGRSLGDCVALLAVDAMLPISYHNTMLCY